MSSGLVLLKCVHSLPFALTFLKSRPKIPPTKITLKGTHVTCSCHVAILNSHFFLSPLSLSLNSSTCFWVNHRFGNCGSLNVSGFVGLAVVLLTIFLDLRDTMRAVHKLFNMRTLETIEDHTNINLVQTKDQQLLKQ